MKRHSSLAHLSREHHGALMLAQLIKKGAPAYKGLPTELEGKVEYTFRFYMVELINHFEEEEQVVIKKIQGINADLDKLTNEIIEEHKALRASFESIKTSVDQLTDLDLLGHALSNHVRKEERELFPMIQEMCSEELLSEIEQALLP